CCIAQLLFILLLVAPAGCATPGSSKAEWSELRHRATASSKPACHLGLVPSKPTTRARRLPPCSTRLVEGRNPRPTEFRQSGSEHASRSVTAVRARTHRGRLGCCPRRRPIRPERTR